ncbi:HARBI1 [Mytilus edulis]|uniref:HARBI1 n=1 Tax=Mytilus edulis TaxID=6550 RepID=A0A8S3VBT8_MYTED|nr:HARBI1 [Mytilus edulis]
MAAFRQVPVAPHRKERHFRLKDDLSLNLSNEELRERYRFGREGINFISNLVSDDITRKTKRNHALTVPQMVMVTLRFLATGSFLQVVGDTIAGSIHQVAKKCGRNKRRLLPWFPKCARDKDGTHVRIQAPSEDEASFVNRKGVHSVNVQAVCDAKGKTFLI